MFRCKECGYEFNIKPEYCDCGNNTFDEIQNKTLHTLPDLRQLLSVLIFILCILLAIIPWTIKDKNPPQKPVVQKAEPVTTKIPDIEKIWDSTPARSQQPKPLTEPIAKKTEFPTPVETTPAKQVKKTPSTQKNVQKASAAKPVTKKEPPKPISQSKPAPKKETPAPIIQPKPVTPQQPTQQQMQKSNVEPKVIKVKPVDQTPLINYKNELRIALLSKLNVPNIQGTGDCVISFSIDDNGKLLNRKFIYKSTNKSLNDEVYFMLMRLPNFKKPPEIYNGEVIKMKFYINNGYYEISIL